jgi:uncharacterized protein
MEIEGPLSEQELDELDSFLMSDATPEDCMDVSMLDGFLTALAIGPNTLPPSQWLPVIWGGEMVWSSKAKMERITTLIFRHANAVLFYLRDDPDTFEPMLYENIHDGESVPVLDEWCSGFVQAMALDEPSWQPMLDSEDGEELLYPILYAAMLGESVMAIQAWWLPQRKSGSTVRRDEEKIGRNDVCPCGSGRKFKKCCGSPERLH